MVQERDKFGLDDRRLGILGTGETAFGLAAKIVSEGAMAGDAQSRAYRRVLPGLGIAGQRVDKHEGAPVRRAGRAMLEIK